MSYMHFIFNLTTFALLGILILLGFVFKVDSFFSLKLDRKDANSRSKRLLLFSAILTFYGIFSLFTLKSYYDAPRSVFSNASHHVLENLGFSFEKEIRLIDENNPSQVLWDDKEGFLKLTEVDSTTTLVELNGLNTPLFAQNANEDYEFKNTIIPKAIKNVLVIKWSDGIEFKLKIVPVNEKSINYTIEIEDASDSSESVVSSFHSNISKGYKLVDILYKNPIFKPAYDSVVTRLASSLLVRKIVDDTESDLLFFPDTQLISSAILVDGETINPIHTTYTFDLENGKYFFTGILTNTTKKIKVENENGKLSALYQLPEYNYLYADNSDSLQQLFITTNHKKITSNPYKRGFLLAGPKDENSIYHFSGSLNYFCGDTKENMLFQFLNDEQKNVSLNEAIPFKANDTLRIRSSNVNLNGFTWLIKIENLKQTNKFTAFYYYGYIGLVIVLCLTVLLFSPKLLDGKSQIIEVAAFLFLIFILTVRTILLWRASTFIPDESVTFAIFQLFRERLFSTNFFLYQFILTALFFLAILNTKFVARKKSTIDNKSKSMPIAGFIAFILIAYIVNGMLKFTGIEQLERLVNVFFPLVIYFAFNHIIQKRALRDYELVTFDSNYYLLTGLNWVLCFTTFAIFDTGFTLIFVLFTLLDTYLKVKTFKDHYHTHLIPKSSIWKTIWFLRHYIYGLMLCILILFNDKIISFAFNNFSISVLFASGLLLFLLWTTTMILKKWRVYLSISIVIFAVLSIFFKQRITDKLEEKNRMLYRAEILFKSADEIIELEEFQSGNDVRILNAAQNKWIIDYYNDKAAVFPLFNNYFKLQPHFQRGSSYLTQVSDLVAVRYLSAEHGKFIIVLILFFVSLLIAIALQYTENYNLWAKTRISVVTLLFTLSFSIWLTSSNRLVFVGQDFPFLSLNSLLALLIGFSILAFYVISSFKTGLYNPDKLTKEYHEESLNGFRINSSKKLIKTYFLPSLFISLVLFLAKTYRSDNFHLNKTVSKLEDKFEGLNTLFSSFQENKEYASAEEALKAFDNYFKSSSEFDKWFSGEDNKFYKSAYEALTTKLIKNNSPCNLLHVRRDVDATYQFGVNGFYFTTHNPDEYEKGWKGNLVEQQLSKSASLISKNNKKVNFSTELNTTAQSKVVADLLNNNIRVSYIPANWTLDNEPVFIVNKTFGEENINQSSFRIKSGGKQYTPEANKFAYILKNGDILHIKNNALKENDLTLQFNKKSSYYLAKNVWLNGRNRFFYPQEENAVWDYHFANFIKEATKNDKSKWENDIPVTIDIELTKQITQEFKNYYKKETRKKDRVASVTVLASDGSIFSLADYKADLSKRFNPNQFNELQELKEQLYLNPDRLLEAKTFGNNNLLLMKPGPGSTFKPILYGSIASQFDLGWENIELGDLGAYPFVSDAKGNVLIKHFGGKKISLVTGGPYSKHSDYDYLLHSTNSFNSMVLYLGSFGSNTLSHIFDANNYLVRGTATNPTENFPLIIKNGIMYRVNDFPNWGEPKAIFHQGLWLNFNLPFTYEQKSENSTQLSQFIAQGINDAYLNESKSSFKLWSQPNESHLYAVDRDLNLSNSIGNIAKGGYPIEVTPLKMAEMTAHLFGMNKAIESHVLKDFKPTIKPFSKGNWASEDALAQFYVRHIFAPMFNVPRTGTITGLNRLSSELEREGIYMYAKTGTISDGGIQDKTLSIVLSQNPIHDATRYTSAAALRQNKFVVLYFNFKKEGGGWSRTALDVLENTIKNTINSTSYKNYMQ
ncbi:hypothetical protein [Emticicia sp. W12TSBA100-4]|uniref:hypothetical protein n=1 Tax=Emticicia sp. W12TSBA100-4 TaxID=3160965 RepID=UPI003306322A